MTIIPKSVLLACAFLSTLALASTAHAGNAFNKYPVQQTTKNTQNHKHGYQVTGVSKTYCRDAHVVTKGKRVKRVVEPLPPKASPNVAYTSGVGTLNQQGFNKMSARKNKTSRAMPVFIDERAYTAR